MSRSQVDHNRPIGTLSTLPELCTLAITMSVVDVCARVKTWAPPLLLTVGAAVQVLRALCLMPSSIAPKLPRGGAQSAQIGMLDNALHGHEISKIPMHILRTLLLHQAFKRCAALAHQLQHVGGNTAAHTCRKRANCAGICAHL